MAGPLNKGWKRLFFLLLYGVLLGLPVGGWAIVARWMVIRARSFRPGEKVLPLHLSALPPDTARPVELPPDPQRPTILKVVSGDTACGVCLQTLHQLEWLHKTYEKTLRDSAQIAVVFTPPWNLPESLRHRWEKVAHTIAYDPGGYFASRGVVQVPATFFITPFGYLYTLHIGYEPLSREGRALLTFIRAIHVYARYIEEGRQNAKTPRRIPPGT